MNDFQKQVWEVLSEKNWVSISAPTSAGKSWIIRHWFVERIRNRTKYTAAYIVPTRALVMEVAEALRVEVGSEAGVFLMPWDPSISEHSRRIFVLTQERLHLLQRERPDLQIDEMFIDEAQNLGDPGRGILLAQVIERSARTSPEIRIIYASPLSSNPSELLSDRPPGVNDDDLLSEYATVNQNLIWVEKYPRHRGKRLVRLIHHGEPIEDATLNLVSRVSAVDASMAQIVFAMGGAVGGNVVYANTPQRAENVAIELQKLVQVKADVPADIKLLQDLISRTIHPNYSLIASLNVGIGFHYGNMPLSVRTEIERLFATGSLEYLICTSTLLEGVNLPCRNIFIRNPKKGRDGLQSGDFWNLAGRAGRWGKEFQGNIICIDTDNAEAWPEVPRVRHRGKLTRAVRTGIANPDDLLAFLRVDADVVNGMTDTAGLFSYLCSSYVETGPTGLTTLLSVIDLESDRSEVELAVIQAVERANLPDSLLVKHAGVSPNSMARLLAHFRASGQQPDYFRLPEPRESNARRSYFRAFEILSKTMTAEFDGWAWRPGQGEDKRKHQLANLIVNWMNGMPLRVLVEQRVGKKTEAKTVGGDIRSVLKDIEQVARFLAPKYLDCYADVLDHWSIEETGLPVQNAPDLVKMLELGVARPAHTTLMTLGLSRTAVLALPDAELDDKWTPSEALSWLAGVDLADVNLPHLIARELQDLVRSFAPGASAESS
ncbi:DEAD/DEAH box helicase [Rathayibacter sp. AY1A7]|uniref:DEAD/DEAH box helicase n=1 Tax=Rathayibacter sp. AY1A7 TaxID=2080524 RepID=UPI0015E3F269|nr:DEAD/DEAH box helicase [Rathayibacter sp. AY1A7]